MAKAKAGFIVYGVHKDGLPDPMGVPFIDEPLVAKSKQALRNRDIELVEHPVVVATKAEAKEALRCFKHDESVDCVVLFSGTWVWAAHMAAAVRDYALTGKPVLIWTHPGSQGWRPVGGLVLHGALNEIGVKHRFVYGGADDSAQMDKIASFLAAARLKSMLNMATIGAFGGRGMGQTCGVADPSQWMAAFGVDIDSRDTTELLEAAKAITAEELKAAEPRIRASFGKLPGGAEAERSIRIYLALKKLIAKHGFDFYTIQSFPGLGDDYSATCFAQSMMLDDGVPTSTLSDFNTALSVFLLTHLSRERVYYGDLQHIDRNTREIKIIGDGAVPPSLADQSDPPDFAAHGIATEGAAGGLSVKLTCKPGKGVLARINRVSGKFVMVVARCEVFVPDKAELEKRKLECGIPFWPHAFLKVEGDLDLLIESYNNEYGVLGYGEALYDELAAFCEQTGIEAVLV